MIIFCGEQTNNLPNWLLDADDQEGHDYELDALREAEKNWVDDPIIEDD